MKQWFAYAAAGILGAMVGAGGVHVLYAQGSPPAFLVAEVEVTDPATFKEYAQKYPATLAPFGAKAIAQGGKVEALEGAPPAGRVVIVQYPNLKAAEDWWNSPAYQELIPIRQKAAKSRIFLVEGLAQ